MPLVPGTKSQPTVRVACAVPPSAAVATTVITVVPGVAATDVLKDPSAAAVVSAVKVVKPVSVLVAATDTVLPGAVVPITVTGDALIADSSAGAVTGNGVVPFWCGM